METEVKLVVACHKPYWQCADPVYCYVEAGAARHDAHVPGILPDVTGDQISGKNETFCELTVLYWAWKNLNKPYLGLCHYRRFFAKRRFGNRRERILTGDELEKCLRTTDVVLPKKRRYWIETNYSQYIHAHHRQDLDTTRQILEEVYPEYLSAYDRSMALTSGHRFNMLLMKRDILDRYCTWLFDILFRLEAELDISQYSPKDRRVFGYVSERLLDVWLEANQISYQELPVVNLERQNWLKKGGMFLLRKLCGSGK